MRVVDEVGVDLVADHDEVVALGEPGQLLQLVPAEDVTGRVVGVAEEEHADRRIGLELGGERTVIERPTVGGALRRDVDDPPAHVGERGEEWRVGGRVHDHAVAGRRRDVQYGLDALDDIAELAVRRRVDGPADDARTCAARTATAAGCRPEGTNRDSRGRRRPAPHGLGP